MLFYKKVMSLKQACFRNSCITKHLMSAPPKIKVSALMVSVTFHMESGLELVTIKGLILRLSLDNQRPN